MQGLSPEIVIGNAFRTLGLSADAGQAEIDSTARRMRIWGDPAEIPPTPWDEPWLGPIRRDLKQIESAVARLTDPTSRLHERIYWFAARNGDGAPLAAGRSRRHLGSNAAGEGDICAVHDGALARLVGAIVAGPEVSSPQRWSFAIGAFCRATVSSDYRAWFASAERKGEFEKKVDDDEIQSSLDAVPLRIALSIATRARDALDRDQAELCMRLVGLLPAALSDPNARRPLETGVCDRIEDILTARCRALQNDLFHNVNWKPGSSARAARANRKVCRRVQIEIRRTVDPLLDALAEFQARKPPPIDLAERMQRIGVPASGMFRNLGLGWQYSGQLKRARISLVRALRLTTDREMSSKLNGDLANLKKTKKKRSSTVAIVIFTAAVIRALTAGLSGTSPAPTSQLPDFRELEQEAEKHRYLNLLSSTTQADTPPPPAENSVFDLPTTRPEDRLFSPFRTPGRAGSDALSILRPQDRPSVTRSLSTTTPSP